VRSICVRTGQTYVFYRCYMFPGPGTSPIRFVSEIRAILKYVCVRSSAVAFYGLQIRFGRFFGQPFGTNKKTNKNQTIILDLLCPRRVFVANHFQIHTVDGFFIQHCTLV